MSKPKIRYQFDYDTHKKNDGEKNGMPSLTVPGESMTVLELINRHAKGLPLNGKKIPMYQGEDLNYPDLERLDLSEIHELRKRTEEIIRNEEKRIEQEKKEKIDKFTQLEIELNDVKGRLEDNLKKLEKVEKLKNETPN